MLADRSAIDGTDGRPTRRHYRVGTVNFSAILHYNRSYFYAAAVTDTHRACRSESRRGCRALMALLRVRLARGLRIDEGRKLHAVLEDAHQRRHVVERQSKRRALKICGISTTSASVDDRPST